MYFLCSENKCTDQLQGYPAANLRLRFCIWKSRFSHDTAQIMIWLQIISKIGVSVMTILDAFTLFRYATSFERSHEKPTFCICENKDADQLRGNREADQRLCFSYIESTIPLLSKSEISSL